MSWLLVSLRRLRQARLAFAGLAALVFVTALVASGMPRVFERVSTDAIQRAVASLPSTDRDIELDQTDPGSPGGSLPQYPTLDAVAAKGTALRGTFPAPLPKVLGPSTYVVETPSYQALQGTTLAAELRLRIMEGVEGHLSLVAGRAPTGAVSTAPNPLNNTSTQGFAQGPTAAATVPQLEAEISASAATKLGLKVGSSIFLAAQGSLDPLPAGPPLAVKIVGIFEPRSAADPYWVDDEKVLGWTLREFSPNVTYVQSTLLLAPQAYPQIVGDPTHAGRTFIGAARRITWRYPAMAQALAPEQFPSVVQALRRLEAIYPSGEQGGAGVVLTTRLLGRLVALQLPWDAAGSVLLVTALGAGAVALATLGLAVAATAEERRRTVRLQRERGASAAQAIMAALVEAMLLTVPPAVIAGFLVTRALPGGQGLTAWIGPLAVAGVTVLLELLAIAPSVLRPPRPPGHEAPPARGATPRRLVFEGLVVVLAVAGAILLRDRGLAGAGAAAVSGAAGVVEPTTVIAGGGPDVFLAAVPVLIGIAAALLAVRLAPLPLAGLARVLAGRRDLVPVLALRRATRGPGAVRVLLILLATTTLGTFASATVLHLRSSADLQAWRDVGAAYRVEPSNDPLAGVPALPETFEAARLPGVSAAATAFEGPVAFSSGGALQTLVALDPAAYARVVAGTPAAIAWPAAMLAPSGPGGVGAAPGSAAAPLPALISPPAPGPFAFAVGDTFQLIIGSQTVSVRALGVLPSFPGVVANAPFVVLPEPQVEAAAPGGLRAPTTAYLRASPQDAEGLKTALAQAAPQARLVERAPQAAALANQPVVTILSAGVVALALLALLYAALAVVASMLLAASFRAAETAHLDALGLGWRQASTMLLVEYGPPVALAALIGLALGLALFAFLAPGLGFGTIIGVAQTAPPAIDPLQVGLLALVAGAIMGLGVALGAPAQRRAAATAVRRGLV